MKFKHLLTCGLSAAVILIPSSAAFAEAIETDSMEMSYGFEMTAPDFQMKEDIVMHMNDNAASASMSVETKEGSEEVKFDLPDYMIAVGDQVFLNSESILGAAGTLTGQTGLAGYASMFGVTEKWVEIPPIDLDALQMDLPAFDVEIPEFDDEMSEELLGILMKAFEYSEDDTQMCYTVNNETLAAALTELDTFKENRLGFIADLAEYAQEVMKSLPSIDVKPAIRNYLDAAAEGFMMADSSLTEEQASEEVDTLVDTTISAALEAYVAEYTDLPLADMWNSLKLSDIASGISEGNSFEAKLIVTADGDISVELTSNEETIKGNAELTADGVVLHILSADDEPMYDAAITFTMSEDQNYACVITDAASGEELLSAEAALTMADDMPNAACHMEIAGTEPITMDGYFNMTTWENDGTLDVPEKSCSLLDVVKNLSFMLRTSMVDTDTEVAMTEIETAE